MNPLQSPLCVTSYNSTGFGIGVQQFLSTLSSFTNILCIQEHFLLDCNDKKYSNTDKLRKLLSQKYDISIVPAHKDNLQVGKGRGKGGLATMWDKSLTKYVSQVKTSSFRLQATKFNFPCGTLLLVNSYFPCDPQTSNFDDSELLKLLADLKYILHNEGCTFNLILGDLNCHFLRKSHFTSTIETFFEDIQFKIFWEHHDLTPGHKINQVDFTYCQTRDQNISTSVIDHFVGNTAIFNRVIEAGVIHSGENLSNHSPIYTKLNLSGIDNSVEGVKNARKVSWSKASEEAQQKFKEMLDTRLASVNVPQGILCENTLCHGHQGELEDYTMEVLEVMENTAKEFLPSSGGPKSGKNSYNIPGWAQYVKPYSEESKFWFSVWISAGKPLHGALYETMLKTKCQYKYAVRRLKRAKQSIQNDKFVAGLAHGGCNIFQEIKKFRGKTRNCSSKIDAEVGAQNIANHFANIYSELYSRHEHGTEFQKLQGEINSSVAEQSIIDANRITEDVVKAALKSMRSGKRDAIFDLQSDCLISGSDILVTHLTYMLRAFVIHGFVPYSILVCTLLPLVKDNLADITSSDNYKAIATGSLILKLLDIVILILEGDKLECDQLQFGFQAKSSTSMCSWVATAVIEYYNRNKKAVYSCAMDLSKAFDLVEWVELFRTLQEKKVAPIFLRILLFIYSNQSCNVSWNGSISFNFPVLNGVRQGAVSSPLLFSIYIDDLIKELRLSGLGCRIGMFFLGCLGYADDLLLMSASRSGLQSMVKICENFARKKSLKFSTNVDAKKSKTKCIIFTRGKESEVSPIILNGDPLPWVKEIKHLGNILQSDNSMKTDCTQKRGKFIGKVNSLLKELHFVDPDVMIRLLNIYTTSFYGSSLWDLYSTSVDRIYKSWNVTIRSVFDLPWRTHRYWIEILSECSHPKILLLSRYVKFVQTMISCMKPVVRLLSSLCQNDRRTLLGRTMAQISLECNTDVSMLTPRLVRTSQVYHPIPDDQQWRIPLLMELLEVRSSNLVIQNLDSVEITQLIADMCIM